jgi:hypothetical protein
MSPLSGLLSETTIGLSAAARRLPPLRGGKPVHGGTLSRWIQKGIRRPDGERVCLEAVRCGGAWMTSVEALERFLMALSTVPGSAAAPLPRTPSQRKRAAERAGRELDKVGI